MTMREALAVMRRTDRNGNPIPFDVTFVTCDRSRHTGGRVKTVKRAYLNSTERKRLEKASGHRGLKGRQNHFRNATRNLKSADGNLTKMHIYLMTRLNGIPVI